MYAIMTINLIIYKTLIFCYVENCIFSKIGASNLHQGKAPSALPHRGYKKIVILNIVFPLLVNELADSALPFFVLIATELEAYL
jgi:hypothetical protein